AVDLLATEMSDHRLHGAVRRQRCASGVEVVAGGGTNSVPTLPLDVDCTIGIHERHFSARTRGVPVYHQASFHVTRVGYNYIIYGYVCSDISPDLGSPLACCSWRPRPRTWCTSVPH